MSSLGRVVQIGYLITLMISLPLIIFTNYTPSRFTVGILIVCALVDSFEVLSKDE